MNRKPVKSSQIRSIGYDGPSRKLEIEFNSGAVYEYDNVDEDVHSGFDRCESVGAYFGAVVKCDAKRYPYRRLKGPDGESER